MSLPPSAPPAGKPGSSNVVPLKPAHGGHGHGRRHKAPEHHEEGGEDGEGNWIISYADMMTLLCVFFVLMYSMANPDPRKYEEFKRETVAAFGGKYKQPYQQLVDKLQQVIKQQGLEKVVKIEADETGVSATFQGTVFFDSGKTDLITEGMTVLTQVGDVLKNEAKGFRIVIEGHTDDVPIVSPTYPSNWELSGARAARVVRMFETMGFDRRYLQAIGFADTKPLVPNRDAQGAAIPQNQSQNRRVVLRVIRNEQAPATLPGSEPGASTPAGEPAAAAPAPPAPEAVPPPAAAAPASASGAPAAQAAPAAAPANPSVNSPANSAANAANAAGAIVPAGAMPERAAVPAAAPPGGEHK